MSNFRALATVTATLQRTLQSAIQADVAGATVTTVRPTEGAGTGVPTVGVNAFLYQVVPNPAWRNADLPARRSNGETAQRPQAALDLHYLFSFYGSDTALEPQRLLGSTVAFLHSRPHMTRTEIDAAVADPTKPFLVGSDLAEQVDLVRFVPLSLSLEDLSRVWSVFFQMRYVLSVAYQASVVLVEPQVTVEPALPTRDFNLTALPLSRSRITSVVAQANEAAPVVAETPVFVHGDELRSAVTRVEIDGSEVAASEIRPDRISLALPPGLPAGAHTVQVRHGVDIGAPGVVHLALSSNPFAFVLRPLVTKTAGQYDVTVSDVVGAGAAPRSATITVGIAPNAGARQVVTLELLQAGAVVHTFLARPFAAPASEVVFDAVDVAAGSYVGRVRVDGAETPVDVDANGIEVAPVVSIP